MYVFLKFIIDNENSKWVQFHCCVIYCLEILGRKSKEWSGRGVEACKALERKKERITKMEIGEMGIYINERNHIQQ